MASIESLVKALRTASFNQGFSHVGITDPSPFPQQEVHFRDWLERGFNARMGYLERNVEKRFNPALVMEGVKSVISLAYPYGDAGLATENRTGIALYAWGEDYHTRMGSAARPLVELLTGFDPESLNRVFTDDAQVAERSVARRSGMGWTGKNGNIITRERGSMVYLTEIFTTIALPPDEPFTEDLCGSCSLCLEACPTGALTGDGILDAARCISYHTNTSKEPMPDRIAASLDGRIYGCDICQQVCPWNTKGRLKPYGYARPPGYPESWPAHAGEWLDKDKNWFDNVFKGSALEHKGFAKLHQNAVAACYGTSGDSPHVKEGK